jgi:Co/Zn/Cd efflux system component
MSTTDIKRRQSIRYINDDIEDDAPPSLTFNSLERGDLDDDFPKTNSFMYNSEEDMYRLNSLKRSRMTERMNSNNLEKIDEELENSYQVTKGDESQEGNIIFANLSNIGLKEKKLNLLYIILVCYLIFSIIELIFGYFSNSLTLMADAAHYFSESSCFGIYIITIYASRKKATNNMSFGFHRGEIIGILVRATFLLGFSIWLMYYIIKGFLYYNIVNGIIIIII